MRKIVLLLAALILTLTPASTSWADNPHRVQRGDTVSGIASSHGTTVRRMKRLNPRKLRNPNRIFPGQKLRVRGKGHARPPQRRHRPGRRSACGGGRNQWRLPVPPRNTFVSQPFFGQYPSHSGVDLAGPLGSKVRSVARGRVVAEYHMNTSYGNHVIVEHACGIRTLYAHLHTTSVFVGERLRAREVLGTRDSTGNSTGHHLHFEVMTSGGFRLNPANYLAGVGGFESFGQDNGSALVSPGAPPHGLGTRRDAVGGPVFRGWPGQPKHRFPWSLVWRRVAKCESSLRWHVNTGNGYYGGLQFWDPTWDEYRNGRFAHRADLARRRAQKIVAERVLHSWQGIGAWPVCGPRGIR